MDHPASQALFALAAAHSAATRSMEARLGALHGLSFMEFRLLRALAERAEGSRATDLAHSLGLTPSGVTRAVLPLEKRGILHRVPDPLDGRATSLHLTDAGRRILDAATATVAETATLLLRRLNVGQSRQLERLLGEIGN